MKIQLTVNEEHQEAYRLLQHIEEEGKGARGYVNEQLRERLKVFQLLAEYFEEDDPMRLLIKIFSGQNQMVPAKNPEKIETKNQEEPVKEEVQKTSYTPNNEGVNTASILQNYMTGQKQ